jgi:NADH-quinone oxidoreductase subunit E
MSFNFNEENLTKIENLKTRYPSPKALTLPLLWLVKEQEGYISLEAIEVIAKETTRPSMEIYKTASFYSMFNFEPNGKYHIQICKTLSCALCGKAEILDYLKEILKIDVGQISEDEKFSLVEVECLGSCSTAPMMQINSKNYENLTIEKIDEILEGLL